MFQKRIFMNELVAYMFIQTPGQLQETEGYAISIRVNVVME